MPPLNNTLLVDEPFLPGKEHLVNRNSPTTVYSDVSVNFHDGYFSSENPEWKFAFPPPPRHKAVSFNPQVHVEFVPSRNDWSEEEKAGRWNSADDYTNFQLDIFNTLFLMRNDPDSMDETCHSARGVECRDPAATKYRRHVRREAWEVVFQTQQIQRERNEEPIGVAYLVASMYCHAAQPAMRLALDCAAQDEMEAKKIQFEDERLGEDPFDTFDDGWVSRCASSTTERTDSLSAASEEDDFGFVIFGETSEFDNSWLRGDV